MRRDPQTRRRFRARAPDARLAAEAPPLTTWEAADDAGRDLFAVLGLRWGADGDAVRAAWRATARRTHPDHGGDAEAFRAAEHARWVLSDETRRTAYLRAHDHLAGRGSSQAAASDPGSVAGSPFADEGDFYRGGWVAGDDADYFDDEGWGSPGTSDGARDDAGFFEDENEDEDDRREQTTNADPPSSDGDPFAWDDAWSEIFDDDFDPHDGSASGAGERSAASGGRSPRSRHSCAGCFRHALLGIDRCWAHASDDELAAAIRLAGPGRCPVLNQRNRPCGARPSELTAPFCIHHALGYRASRRRPAASARRAAGSRASGFDAGRDHDPHGGRPRSPRDRTHGTPRDRAGRSPGAGTRSATRSRSPSPTPARQATATSGDTMAGCLGLVGLFVVVAVVLMVAGFIQDAAPGTSTVSAVFQTLIGLWVLRRLIGRRSRRRRR